MCRLFLPSGDRTAFAAILIKEAASDNLGVGRWGGSSLLPGNSPRSDECLLS